MPYHASRDYLAAARSLQEQLYDSILLDDHGDKVGKERLIMRHVIRLAKA